MCFTGVALTAGLIRIRRLAHFAEPLSQVTVESSATSFRQFIRVEEKQSSGQPRSTTCMTVERPTRASGWLMAVADCLQPDLSREMCMCNCARKRKTRLLRKCGESLLYSTRRDESVVSARVKELNEAIRSLCGVAAWRPVTVDSWRSCNLVVDTSGS